MRRRDAVPRRRRGVRTAEGRDRRAGGAADPPARAGSPRSTSDRTGVDVTELEGGGAAGGLAGGLAAIGATLEPGFDVVAQAAGLEDALDGVDLVVTGEGKLDRDELRGQGRRRGARVGGGARASRTARSSSGRRRDEGREELSVRGDVQLLTLTDRVWQAGEAFARAALLVEEAALEAGRAASRRRLGRQLAAELGAVRGDREHRRALAHLDRDPLGRELVVEAHELGHDTAVSARRDRRAGAR